MLIISFWITIDDSLYFIRTESLFYISPELYSPTFRNITLEGEFNLSCLKMLYKRPIHFLFHLLHPVQHAHPKQCIQIHKRAYVRYRIGVARLHCGIIPCLFLRFCVPPTSTGRRAVQSVRLRADFARYGGWLAVIHSRPRRRLLTQGMID